MGGDEKGVKQSRGESQTKYSRDYIKVLYDSLLELGYLFKDLYDMTLYELEHTVECSRQGLAYKIWRISSFVHSPFVKNFPNSPKEAMPELFIQEKGIPMPEFLIDKAIKRGVL